MRKTIEAFPDGFCDLFLMPDLMRYDVKHSYILELKYLSAKDSEAKAEAQWEEATTQIKGYAAPKVLQMVHDTELHCIVMQFRGWELERNEWRKYKLFPNKVSCTFYPHALIIPLYPPILRTFSYESNPESSLRVNFYPQIEVLESAN